MDLNTFMTIIVIFLGFIIGELVAVLMYLKDIHETVRIDGIRLSE